MLHRKVENIIKKLDCQLVADSIQTLTIEKRKLIEKIPKVTILLSEDLNGKTRLDSSVYVKKKIEFFNKLNINSKIIRFNEKMCKEEIFGIIDMLNNDPTNNGIFVQLPLKGNFNFKANQIIDRIHPHKDVDGLGKASQAGLLNPFLHTLKPATSLGVCALLDYYNIDVIGKRVCIIGKGDLVGKPLSLMLMSEPFNATVITCDVHTKNLKEISSNSDVIVAACGQPNLIQPDYVNSKSIVIDVGINRVFNKNTSKTSICGDVHPSTYEYCKFYTSVPGGIGLITVSTLAHNIINAYNIQNFDKPLNLVDDLRYVEKKTFPLISDNNQTKKENGLLRILLVSSGYNAITQFAERELKQQGYTVSLHIAKHEESIRQASNEFKPNLIICPMLKTKIPQDVFEKIKCLIVHPGIPGDRGPSSIDHAILNKENEWGVTILEANHELDAGDIWAHSTFPMQPGFSKTNIYSTQVTKIAQKLILECVEKFKRGNFVPEPLDYSNPNVKGKLHEVIKGYNNKYRVIDWAQDKADVVLRKILAADTAPGIKSNLIYKNESLTKFLYGAHFESYIKPGKDIKPGEIFGRRNEAVCVATCDGNAVWITQLKSIKSTENPNPFKLPAILDLGMQYSQELAEYNIELGKSDSNTFQEISFETFEDGKYGVLNFDFYNGAMSTDQCNRLVNALKKIKQQSSLKVLTIAGSAKNWSNGIHLNVIENAKDQKQEGWSNIKAINKIVKELLLSDHIITISAIQVNAGAGGFFLALASDFVFANQGTVFNPHYKNMGLYGSELHTYTAANRIGKKKLDELLQSAEPLLQSEAVQLGLVDNLDAKLNKYGLEAKTNGFMDKCHSFARHLLMKPGEIEEKINNKKKLHKLINLEEKIKEHEDKELSEMYLDICNDRNEFSKKRFAFVNKLK